MRRVMAVLAVLCLGAGCGDGRTDAPSSGSIAVADTVVLDVRTPAEFAAGHLDGALNIDVQAADFGARIAALDPTASYVVYCRSGARAGAAIETMRAAGFTALVNAGSLEEAGTATGLEIVR